MQALRLAHRTPASPLAALRLSAPLNMPPTGWATGAAKAALDLTASGLATLALHANRKLTAVRISALGPKARRASPAASLIALGTPRTHAIANISTTPLEPPLGRTTVGPFGLAAKSVAAWPAKIPALALRTALTLSGTALETLPCVALAMAPALIWAPPPTVVAPGASRVG